MRQIFTSAVPLRRVSRLALAPVVAITLAVSPLAVHAAGAIGTTSTSPTPPDLFVAYAPLVSQGNTPGADTAESFNTQLLASLSSPSDGASASTGSAQVGAQPIAEAVSPDGGTVYVLNSASDTLTSIETLASPPQVEATYSLPTGYTPTALAVTPDGLDAYVVGYPSISNSLTPALWEISLTGTSPGTLMRTILLPANSSPAGLAVTPSEQVALVTDYSGGDVIPVNLANGLVGTPITVGNGPIGIQISPNGNDAYVANSESGTVSQIDLSDDAAATPVELEIGYSPQQVAVSPDGSTLWVSEDSMTSPANAGFAVPVEIPDMTVDSPVAVGYDPNGLAISPDGTTLYIADETNGYSAHTQGAVTMIDTSSDTATSFYTSIDPAALVVTPDEAPVASYTTTTAPVGAATCFNATNSYSLTNGPLHYAWNFGDGTVSPPATAADPTICHTYLLPGSYDVTLDVTDLAGTSTEIIYNGQSVLNNGGPSAGETSTVVIPTATVDNAPIAYVTDSLANEVTPILAEPGQAVSPNDVGTPVSVGVHPDAIAITPNGQTALVANFGSDNITPINIPTNSAEPQGGWISVGSEPDAIAITPNGQTALVANSGDGTVSKIALSTNQVVDTITVGGSPSGIAIAPDGLTAYVTDNAPGYNDLIGINLASDTVEPGVAAGTDPLAVAITPDGNVAIVADRGSNIVPGAVTPISLTSYPPVTGTAVDVGNNPDAIAISSHGDEAYVANGADGTLSQIAISSDALGAVSTATTGGDPSGVAITPDGTTAYVANDVPGAPTSVGTVSVLGVPTPGGVPTPVNVGAGPDAVAITPDQAPVASLSVTAAPSGQPTFFSATQTVAPSAPAVSYTWNFCDGTAPVETGTATTMHTYATGGTYSASVTVTDADGTSTTQSFTGQTVSLNGAATAQASATVVVPYVVPTVTGVSPNTGDAGETTSLIVTGTDLFGVTQVDVGGVSVSGFSVNSSGTEISNVFAPSSFGPGSVDVTVTNPGGTSAITPADVFTYLPTTSPVAGAPVVTALSQGWGPVAGGTGVTITGTDLSGATEVDFGSVAASNFEVNAAGTAITVVSPPAGTAGTVDVTVVTPVATSQVDAADAFTYLAPVVPVSAPTITEVAPNTGPTSGLTTVTITGTNVGSVTAVNFGLIPAQSFILQSATSLTAVSPAVPSAGTVDITVTSDNGTSAVVPSDAFTYTDGTTSAGPDVESVTPDVGPLSGGNTVVIAGTNFVDLSSTAVDFGSVASPSFSVNSAGTQITATTPLVGSSQSVDVTVTNPQGVSTITSADVYTYQPDAEFAPTISSVSPSSGPQAGGTTVTVTGTNLSPVSVVDFGSAPVTSFSVSNNGDELFVTSPVAGAAGTVSLTVTSPYGTSADSVNNAFTYLPVSPPTTGPQVTLLVPQVGPVSGGTGVVITGTGLSSATAVNFGSEPAESFTVNAAGTQIIAVSPAAGSAGSVDVTVVVDAQTSPIATSDVFTYVNGLAPPGPTIATVTPVSGPLAGDTSVTVTGTNLTGTLYVDFGSVPGTQIAVNAAGTSLTVNSPSASLPSTVVVTLATPDGQSVPNANATFKYLPAEGSYVPVAPYRLLDTRTPSGGGALGAGQTRTLVIAGVDGVPSTATAVIVNLTVTDTTSATTETIYPTGSAQPSAVSLIAQKNDTVAHLTEVPLGVGGAVSIYNASGSSHVVVDLEGYVTDTTGTSGGFIALAPKLVLNTAAKKGGGPVKVGAPRKVKLTGIDGVPGTGVAAVLFYLTATTTTAPGFATVYPAGGATPNASNLNWIKGATVTNLVSADVNSFGNIDIALHAGSANLSLVVVGYVSAPGAALAGHFTSSVSPVALFSSGGHPVVTGSPATITVGGVDGVPIGATSVVVNVTASDSAAATIRLYAQGSPPSSAAGLSVGKGQTVSTLEIVPLSNSGQIDVSTSAGSAGVVIVVEGFCQ